MSENRPLSHAIPGDPIGTVRNTVGEAADAMKGLFGSKEDHQPLPTVAQVDPERYAGRWYELARLPLRFQKDETVSVAQYTVFVEGTIGVHNVSFLGDDLNAVIDGTARPAEGAEKTFVRLRVKFGGLAALAPDPDEGNYWILALTDDYSLALVGTPDRESLWLLARDPKSVDAATATAYVSLATELGFDTSALLYGDWDTRRTTNQPFWS